MKTLHVFDLDVLVDWTNPTHNPWLAWKDTLNERPSNAVSLAAFFAVKQDTDNAILLTTIRNASHAENTQEWLRLHKIRKRPVYAPDAIKDASAVVLWRVRKVIETFNKLKSTHIKMYVYSPAEYPTIQTEILDLGGSLVMTVMPGPSAPTGFIKR